MEPTYETIISIRDKIQKCEPHPYEYLFQHTYDAAKRVYDRCQLVIDASLCSYCGDCRYCDWFCNGSGFEPKGLSKNLIDFILTNWHHCPFSDNCGIDFENECTGWGEGECAKCILHNSDKLNIKE